MASFLQYTMNDLPLEMVLEIFYKLPVKQLHRNKIVCKLWLSLISHPSFPSRYSVRATPSNAIGPSFTIYQIFPDQFSYSFNGEHLTYDAESMSWSKNTQAFSLDFLPDIFSGRKVHHNVLASSNGLLLCTKTYFDFLDLYYVCNPVTRQWFPLPPPPTHGLFTLWGMICYPNSLFENGSMTQFKVLKIVSPDDQEVSNVFNMEIFDSATNQWRSVLTNTPFISRMIFSTTMFTALEHMGIVYCIHDGFFIIAFDPNLDLCHQIRLPRNVSPSFGLSVFGASQGHLYYAKVNYSRTRIWRCLHFGGKYTWSFHRIFSMEWIENVPLQNPDIKVLAMDPMDSNILYISSSNRVSCIRRIYSLDLERREMRELCYFPLQSRNVDWVYDMRSLMFLHSSWPTRVPRMSPGTNPMGVQGRLEHPPNDRERQKTR